MKTCNDQKIMVDLSTLTADKNIITYKDQFGSHIMIRIPDKSMWFNDFKGIFPEIKCIEILDLYVPKESRNKYRASGLIKHVIDNYPDYAIISVAGASISEYPEEPLEDDMKKIAQSLVSFYEKNGFININDKIGGYQLRKVCLYIGNDIGKGVYEKLCLM